MTTDKTGYLSFVVLLCIALTCILPGIGCTTGNNNKAVTGKELSDRYCGSCHMPVAPGMLDSITWINDVLPPMARKLGINVLFENQYHENENDEKLISLADWIKIVNYYKEKAPKKLPGSELRMPHKIDSLSFTIRRPTVDTAKKANTTMVAFNPADKHIYTSNGSGELIKWNQQLMPILSKTLPSAAVHVNFSESTGDQNGAIFTCIGSIAPMDIPKGTVQKLSLTRDDSQAEPLFTGLLRPVHSLPGDFNKDGIMDWVICAFGHNEGGLYLFTQNEDGGYEKKELATEPGSLRTIAGDFNNDGWLDLMVLYAYSNERIELLLNDQQGGFKSKLLLSFSPLSGSSGFQLIDFNNDGNLDILYTSGDNADLSMILKPYHGIYIYLNKGDFNFTQSYFYPVNGCYKAVAADFDKDGDLDIASIAFYPDFEKHPYESFIYFKNEGSLSFLPYQIQFEHPGRWLCMDVKDSDSDGDDDIILGNYSGPEANNSEKSNWHRQSPFIILENNTFN